jgi:hypothetical protein
MIDHSLTGQVGIFFVAEDGLLLHTCAISDGEPYGDFVSFPESHDAVWQQEYACRYGVDFDFYPRGRVICDRKKGIYKLFYDPCAVVEAEGLRLRHPEGPCELHLDEQTSGCAVHGLYDGFPKRRNHSHRGHDGK